MKAKKNKIGILERTICLVGAICFSKLKIDVFPTIPKKLTEKEIEERIKKVTEMVKENLEHGRDI